MTNFIICFAVLIVTAALNGAEKRITQHRTTLFPGKNTIPSWWPNEKLLGISKSLFQFVFIVSALISCVDVVNKDKPVYIVVFILLVLFCWPLGELLGIWCASTIVRLKGRRNHTRVLHECLWTKNLQVYLEDFFRLIPLNLYFSG